jgi:hypothetical protein
MKDNKPVSLSSKINILNTEQVIEWTRKLGVSRERLTAAVKEVGNNANEVEMFLKKGLKKTEIPPAQPGYNSIL